MEYWCASRVFDLSLLVEYGIRQVMEGLPTMLPPDDVHAVDEGIATPLEPVPVEPPLPLPKERMESGKKRRSEVPRSSHAVWQACPRPSGSDRAPGRVEPAAPSTPGPDTLRANAGVAVHVPAGQPGRHGPRPGQDSGQRHPCAGLRRRPLDELRRLCQPRAKPAVRPQ